MTPQELKNSILQLAIQGKLVEQRPEEGSSFELVTHIRDRQTELLKTKTIKLGKYDKTIPEEYYFDIPETWTQVKIGDITTLVTKQTGFDYSKRIKPSLLEVKADNTYPLIQTRNFKGKRFNMESAYYVPVDVANEYEQLILNKQCLLVSIVGSIGNVGWFNEKRTGFLGGAITKIDLIDNCLIEYLFYFLQSPYGQYELRKNEKKTAQSTITVEDVRNITIPIPPLAEQKRIVAKIDELLPLIDRYEQAWARLEAFNKRFPSDMQKSLLQLAIQGKLVEQRPEEGTGEELYQKIQAEKQSLIRSGKLKKDKPLPPISDDELPFDIPENWKWVRFASVIDVRDGTHDTPKYVPEGIPLVTSKNLIDGRIDFATAKNISCEDAATINLRSRVDDGDILFAMIGTIGNPVLVKKEQEFSIKNMALFKPIKASLLDMQYVLIFLRKAQVDMKKIANASVQSFVSLTLLRNYVFPLPPFAEQRRIVAKLEELLPLCEKLK